MTRRTRVVLGASVALLFLVVLIVAGVRSRRVHRRPVFTPAGDAVQKKAEDRTLASLSVGDWTARMLELQQAERWDDLDEELEEVAETKPGIYQTGDLRYLHARVKIETDDLDEAATLLEPYLASGHPLRELALYHRSVIAEADNEDEQASGFRRQLLREYPRSQYVSRAQEDELSYLSDEGDHAALNTFAAGLPPALKRDALARAAAALDAAGQRDPAMRQALSILEGNVADDAADRAARVLDKPEILGRLTPQQIARLGTAAQSHRRYDRAVALLGRALPHLPDQRDDLLFAIGRSHFGAERYAEARHSYLAGANGAKTPLSKATFLFHASRSSQLAGDDASAEREMTAAIAVPGRFPATAAALTQRLRTRLVQKRLADARRDFDQIRKLFPNDHAIVDAAFALAVALHARGDMQGTIAVLDSMPRALLDEYESAEVSYWRGRSFEASDAERAAANYLEVLRAGVPTHFAYFARKRLAGPAAQGAAPIIARKKREVAAASGEGQHDAARRLQTDVVLLSPAAAQAAELAVLRELYAKDEVYRRVLEARPADAPTLAENPPESRMERLLAMGLYDDAADEISGRYGLGSLNEALTRSVFLQRAAASRESIHAAEVLMNRVPDDFVPQLLPRSVQTLLYPRYFLRYITEDSEKYEADPTLVVSIMREESRFNPRAKSAAAARGLLQFIITTARSVGADLGIVDLDPEDLYDPRTIIRLGAKYIGELLGEFGGNRYRAAAAYNAGPIQVKLWSRIAPAPGDDYFLSSINFEETKHYVRKVLNSYERYAEIYGNAPPSGGLRPEP